MNIVVLGHSQHEVNMHKHEVFIYIFYTKAITHRR